MSFQLDLDTDLLTALQVCALPHWLDDCLAEELLEIVGCNGSSAMLTQQIKALPVVQPFETASWRVNEDLRGPLIDGFRSTETYSTACEFLADRFARETDDAADQTVRRARIAQWRAAYHFADIAPDQSATRLCALVDTAALCDRVADVEVAIDLFADHPALRNYEVELAYSQGRLDYANKRDAAARVNLQLVWDAGRADRLMASAGHLLAIIAIRQKDSSDGPQRVLRRSAEIAADVQDDTLRAHILNTLVARLMDRSHGSSPVEIESLAEESASVQRDLGASAAAIGYSTLGEAQMRRGPERYVQARRSFALAVEFAERSGDLQRLARALLPWSSLARREQNLVEACELMDRVLMADIERGASDTIRRTATRFADICAETELPDDWTIVERSPTILAYVHRATLVVIARAGETPRQLSVPRAAQGSWRRSWDGRRIDLGPVIEVAELLAGRTAAVLSRA
jgi:hypothetical protein